MRHPATILAALGALLVALTIGGLLFFWGAEGKPDYDLRLDILVGLIIGAVFVYFAAVRVALRHSLPPQTVWIVLAVATVLRLALLPAPPLLSSDIYRYVWDGRVQAAGINPFKYVPADPALAALRDEDIYPSINRRDYAPTIYPPAAQIVFAAVGLMNGGVLAMKAVMLAFEALAIGCMIALLGRLGLPRERILIYAWNPLTLWSFACDGHVDALAIGCLGLALLLRSLRRDGLAGAAIAGATLSKFFPVAVAPAFVRGGSFWRPAGIGLAIILALYGLYASAGSQIFGFLSGYRSEEGLDTGSGFWLLAGLNHLAPLPSWATGFYITAIVVIYASIVLSMLRARETREREDGIRLCRDAAILAAFATAAVSPHYPWYFAWLALPCVVAPIPSVIWLSAAPALLYIDPLDDRFLWSTLIYGPALLLTAIRIVKPRFHRVGTLHMQQQSP